MPTSRTIAPPVDVKGPSLARGPAWVVGIVLAVFGLILFFKVSGTPLGTGGFPDGAAVGDRFIGFEANAWTAWLTTAAGVVMLIGAAQHAAAKLTSLIIGLALGAAAVIALVDGNDVLGLAAANGLTALGWGIAAAVLIVTALLPRLGRKDRGVVADRRDAVPVTTERDARNRHDRDADRELEGRHDAQDGVVHDHRGLDGRDHADGETRVRDRAAVDRSEDETVVHEGDRAASTPAADGTSVERPTEVRYPGR